MNRNGCKGEDKVKRVIAKMKVTMMTDDQVQTMITRIQEISSTTRSPRCSQDLRGASRSTTTYWRSWGEENEHNRKMAAMLERAKVKGVTLKLAKSTISEAEVKRFGRILRGRLTW